MSEILNFPGKRAPVEVPETETSLDAAVEMVKNSAVMQLVSTLAFYGAQGYDGGAKARAAAPALREILAGRGITLVLPS